jgi:hypothetical protein
MWLFLLAIISSTSLWAAGVDYYHWKDLELPLADKDRLFVNYQLFKDYHINFPSFRLFNNREMKGEPAFEFTSRGTLEKGELKCALDSFGCQHGPIYKRPWGHRDGGHYAVYFPIEKHIDDTNFEIKYGGQSYFLSLSNLKDYKPIVIKFNSTEHQNSKNYWIQKSHPNLLKKFKEKMPRFEEEKKKAIVCLRSQDNKCVEKYSIESSLVSLKETFLESGDVSTDSEYYKQLNSYDYTNKNMNVRNALADCLENGKILTDVFTNPVGDMLATAADFYSTAQIDFVEGLKLNFECSFGFKTDKSGEVKSIQTWFSYQLDI